MQKVPYSVSPCVSSGVGKNASGTARGIVTNGRSVAAYCLFWHLFEQLEIGSTRFAQREMQTRGYKTAARYDMPRAGEQRPTAEERGKITIHRREPAVKTVYTAAKIRALGRKSGRGLYGQTPCGESKKPCSFVVSRNHRRKQGAR